MPGLGTARAKEKAPDSVPSVTSSPALSPMAQRFRSELLALHVLLARYPALSMREIDRLCEELEKEARDGQLREMEPQYLDYLYRTRVKGTVEP